MMEERATSGRGPSIWTRPERAARGPLPEHSRAEIAAAGITLADARGLGSVTMRSAAAAIGTAPASLYRYVATRDELVELMADQVYGELSYEPPTGQPAADLLRLAQRARALYHRHPWLLDVPATGNLPGPNAVAFIEHILAALAGVDLSGPAKLETVGLFSGVVRLFAQTEIGQQRAGQDTAQWQGSLAGYLLQIAAAGQHPHLAAALAGQPEGAAGQPDGAAGQPDGAAGQAGDGGSAGQEPLFDRAMTRILTGLLPPSAVPPPPVPPPPVPPPPGR
jgi:AcrR family transcriptional regulator